MLALIGQGQTNAGISAELVAAEGPTPRPDPCPVPVRVPVLPAPPGVRSAVPRQRPPRTARLPRPGESIMGFFARFRFRSSAEEPGWLRRWVMPPGHDDPEIDRLKRAAAADVAEVEEDQKHFDPNGPGQQDDGF